MPPFVRHAARLALFLALGFLEQNALAEEDAAATDGGLALPRAHRMAEEALRGLLLLLPVPTQHRLRGTYLAFDGASLDVNALAACDDDGDHVVVLTDSLLLLLDFVAQASASDTRSPAHKLLDYGAFIGASQRAGKRFLPPAPGFFERDERGDGTATRPTPGGLEAERFEEALTGLVAHELAHILDGDVACRAPTSTREQGDDVWTPAEQAQAIANARLTYTADSALEAHRMATKLLRGIDASGPRQHGEPPKGDGYLDFLTFVDAAERARPTISPIVYLTFHPHPAAWRQGESTIR